MKFVISTQELNYLVNRIQNIIPTRGAIPILSNILIEAANGVLTLTATDLTVGVRCSTEVKVLEEGATTVPGKRFAQLVHELTSVNVEIRTNANDVTEVIADSSRFKLNGMSRNEFPALPDMSEAQQFKLPQAQLKQMFFYTSFAVSKDDNRYALTGVHLHLANGRATFEGTDGKRLARSFLILGEAAQNLQGSYIIPLKAVDEIAGSLLDEGDATVMLLQDKIAVSTDQVMVVSKLLSGEYPDVQRVIPEASQAKVSLHREELLHLLKQVSLFTADSTKSVRFSFGEGEVRLMANTMEIGEGKVHMPVNYHGERIDIAFNPGYFIDILRHTKKETLSIGLTDSFNPGVISDAEGSGEANPLYVIMPMRLHED
jgi:DNA polymerase-3 subunit beta